MAADSVVAAAVAAVAAATPSVVQFRPLLEQERQPRVEAAQLGGGLLNQAPGWRSRKSTRISQFPTGLFTESYFAETAPE